MSKAYDLLVLPPTDKPIYFIVEREDNPDYREPSHWKFAYESHSCPTNWLDPVHIVHDGDSDPHGLIRYIGTKLEADLPPDENWGPNDRDFAFDAWVESTNGVIPELED